MPGPEVIGHLALPGNLLEMLGLLDHRLGLQVAVAVDLARRDCRQRRVDRLRVELGPGEGELAVVEEPPRRVVLPALPGLEHAVVEAGQERPGIDRGDLDVVFLQLVGHGLGNRLDRVLGSGVDTGERVDVQSLADARVVHQDLDPPVERLAAVAVAGDVELLHLQGHSPVGRLSLQRLDLGVDLHPGDHVEALLRQAHGGLVSEAGARPRDEDLLEC
jgi:hypothetical protein